MKKLHVKLLATTILMGSSFLASTGAVASVSLTADGGATEVSNPATACKAYKASDESKFVPDWSSVYASSPAWIHCPVSSTVDLSTAAFANDVVFNVEMPVGSTSTVYNCYIAEQTATASGASERTVIWEQDSGVGTEKATILGADITAKFAETGNAGGFAHTYTSGCYLNTGHYLHSVNVETAAQ